MFETDSIMRMRSKCIDFISGRKSVAGNKFSDIDFLYDMERFAIRRCLRLFRRFFRPYYYFRFKI